MDSPHVLFDNDLNTSWLPPTTGVTPEQASFVLDLLEPDAYGLTSHLFILDTCGTLGPRREKCPETREPCPTSV